MIPRRIIMMGCSPKEGRLKSPSRLGPERSRQALRKKQSDLFEWDPLKNGLCREVSFRTIQKMQSKVQILLLLSPGKERTALLRSQVAPRWKVRRPREIDQWMSLGSPREWRGVLLLSREYARSRSSFAHPFFV